MKKRILLISVSALVIRLYSQEIKLPKITTYIPKSVEQKQVITSEEIQSAHYEDLSDLIEDTGIQNLSYGPYGLEAKPSIRGFTDETVRVVIDGICVNNAQYGTFDFSTINLSSVEKIEIIRGGFTEGVEDEGAVGGVIYITTKKTGGNGQLSAEASAKTFFNSLHPLDSFFQKLDWNGMLGEATYLNTAGTINYAGNKYFYKTDKIGNLPSGIFGAVGQGKWKNCENAQVGDVQANLNLTHYLGDGNSLTFGELFYGGIKNTPGPANSDNPGIQRDYNNNLSLSLWNPAVKELFNLKNSLVWLCNNRFYKDRAGNEDSTHYINTLKYTGTADFTSLAGGTIHQLAGLSFDFTKLDSTNDGQHVQFSGVIKETTKIAVGSSSKSGWSISLPMAAKFCLNDDKVNFAFVPKAGVCWDGNLTGFFADVYRMVQFPNMDDLFWEGAGYYGNPELKPESGWGADVGLNLRGRLHGTISLFTDYYKDKIQWASGTTQNVASACYLGLDFNLGTDFIGGLISVDINGEYLYTRLLDKSNEYTYGKKIMWTPDFVCSLTLGWNLELARIRLNAQYTGIRYTSNLNLYWLDPYLLVNFSVEAPELGGRFTPFMKINNLLNWQYQSVDGYPMPGASLTLGARYNFL